MRKAYANKIDSALQEYESMSQEELPTLLHELINRKSYTPFPPLGTIYKALLNEDQFNFVDLEPEVQRQVMAFLMIKFMINRRTLKHDGPNYFIEELTFHLNGPRGSLEEEIDLLISEYLEEELANEDRTRGHASYHVYYSDYSSSRSLEEKRQERSVVDKQGRAPIHTTMSVEEAHRALRHMLSDPEFISGMTWNGQWEMKWDYRNKLSYNSTAYWGDHIIDDVQSSGLSVYLRLSDEESRMILVSIFPRVHAREFRERGMLLSKSSAA